MFVTHLISWWFNPISSYTIQLSHYSFHSLFELWNWEVSTECHIGNVMKDMEKNRCWKKWECSAEIVNVVIINSRCVCKILKNNITLFGLARTMNCDEWKIDVVSIAIHSAQCTQWTLISICAHKLVVVKSMNVINCLTFEQELWHHS